MIGITAIETALGEFRLSAASVATESGYPAARLEQRTGFSYLAECGEPAPEIHLAEKALDQLIENRPKVQESLELLIYVGQVRSEQIPHASAILHSRFELPTSCEVLDLSLGCTGYVQALGLVRDYARSRGVSHAVVVTSDPYRQILRADDGSTRLVFSDAATATFLSEGVGFRLGEYQAVTQSKDWTALRTTNRQLEMDGRVVLRTARTIVPRLLFDTAAKGGVPLDKVDLFLVHQGSRAVVDAIRKETGLSEKCLPFEAEGYGNTVSSSLPFLLRSRVSSAVGLSSGEDQVHNMVVCGFGVGLAASAMLLKRTPHEEN